MTNQASTYEIVIVQDNNTTRLLDFVPLIEHITGVAEIDNQILLYVQHEEDITLAIQSLEHFLNHSINFKVHEIPYENWNTKWESEFDPVAIDDFCLIYAPFHTNINKSEFQFTVCIMPQMSFGTGHHETTEGIIRLMEGLDAKNKSVMDFGTGTGILGILSSKMGAKKVAAIDYDPICIENTKENMQLNNIVNMQVFLGDSMVNELGEYHVVCCNVTRNVVLKEMPNIQKICASGSDIFLSGYHQKDVELIDKEAKQLGWELMQHAINGKWAISHFKSAG